MRHLKYLIAIAIVGSLISTAEAQPPTFLDLGDIGDAGLFVFDTEGSGFDTELGLFDSDGLVLDSDDDGGPGLESEIEFNLPDGTYFLAISEFNSVFEDGFLNTGTAFEPGETATAILNINGTFGGSLDIGEAAGLDETGFFQVTVGGGAIPEPTSALVLIGAAGTALLRRRR